MMFMYVCDHASTHPIHLIHYKTFIHSSNEKALKWKVFVKTKASQKLKTSNENIPQKKKMMHRITAAKSNWQRNEQMLLWFSTQIRNYVLRFPLTFFFLSVCCVPTLWYGIARDWIGLNRTPCSRFLLIIISNAKELLKIIINISFVSLYFTVENVKRKKSIQFSSTDDCTRMFIYYISYGTNERLKYSMIVAYRVTI